jgi:hypothetical protein
MSAALRGPVPIRGFLGNGEWIIAVHTRKCARQRRRVTPAARARTMLVNHGSTFVAAMRELAATGSTT